MNVLEVRHVTVSFGALAVVDDLSFTVAEGESLAIIGPTGSGKTVLFRALIGALPYRARSDGRRERKSATFPKSSTSSVTFPSPVTTFCWPRTASKARRATRSPARWTWSA
jgi:ABC-type glutathione transport system ATPase component